MVSFEKAQKVYLKLEAIWWMSRPASRMTILMAVCGWLSVDSAPIDSNHIMLVILFAGLFKSILVFINDLCDAEDDLTTAPHLPIPSGVISKTEAVLSLLIIYIATFVSLFILSSSTEVFILTCGIVVIASVLEKFYCDFKHTGFIATTISATLIPIFLLTTWITGGGGSNYIIPLTIYAFIAGFSGNILAAMRDVDKDPIVGNRTVPVRIGARKAFILVAALTALDTLFPIILSFTVPGGIYALPIVFVSILMMGVAYKPLLDGIDKDTDRISRLKDMELWGIGKYLKSLSLLCIFSMQVGLITGCLMQIAFMVSKKAYKQRIVKKEIANALQNLAEAN